MYEEGCYQCDQLPVERRPIKLANPTPPKPQVAKGPSYKAPAHPTPVAPVVSHMTPTSVRKGATAMLVVIGSKFSGTTQIWDVHANQALPTSFSSSTQVYSNGYAVPSTPGNYQFYLKDSVSGLKSVGTPLKLIVRP